jgi:hypothetical protein
MKAYQIVALVIQVIALIVVIVLAYSMHLSEKELKERKAEIDKRCEENIRRIMLGGESLGYDDIGTESRYWLLRMIDKIGGTKK